MNTNKASNSEPYVIVFGNEKGGTGKSTLAMHAITSLLYDGYRVGTIDIDSRQGTLSRYVENRKRYVENSKTSIPLPEHFRVIRSTFEQEKVDFEAALDALKDMDYIVIDTPGSDTPLSREAHTYADTLVTPLNDSFIDLDLLVSLDTTPDKILHPSLYAEMVWEQRKQKAVRSSKPLDWIVVRNRVGHLYTKNKEQIYRVLQALAKRIGFKLASGFGERVIFRELFLSGLTLLDLEAAGETLTISHTAARQELRLLMSLIPEMEKRQTGEVQVA